MPGSETRIAIVGAGIGGLTCARRLAQAGVSVQVFDKGRGVGGRMSVRRTENGGVFDHGAQYFTVRDERFREQIQRWLKEGVAAEWTGKIVSLSEGTATDTSADTRRYVGAPGMNAIAKYLAADLKVSLQAKVTNVSRDDKLWRLTMEDGLEAGPFDWLILNAPGPQSSELMREYPSIVGKIRPAVIAPCWAVMVSFGRRLDVEWDGAFVEDSPLSWVARNDSKPGRPSSPECWVLHASAEWSIAHLEQSSQGVADELINAFWRANGLSPEEPTYKSAHRWRFALPTEPLEQTYLLDEELHVGVCGDWCGGPRVEGAYLSGLALAEAVHTRRNS